MFGELNSNKLSICTFELINFLLMVLIYFANIHKHVHVENQATPTQIFHLEQLSASSGVQESRGMYSLFNAEGSLMRVCTCMCLFVCSQSSLKNLGQLKPNFMWNHNGKGEDNLFKLFWSFVVLHLNIVSLMGWGLFAGLLPQMWSRSAGLLAGLWKLKS